MVRPPDIEIRLNGDPKQVPAGASVADLIALLELTPEQVAVEVNRELEPRAERGERSLAEGDRVELVTMVGGG